MKVLTFSYCLWKWSFISISLVCSSIDLGFPGDTNGKESACNIDDVKDACLIPGLKDLLEEAKATHSSIFACRIPWTAEPGKPQSMGVTKRQTWLIRLSTQTCNVLLSSYLLYLLSSHCIFFTLPVDTTLVFLLIWLNVFKSKCHFMRCKFFHNFILTTDLFWLFPIKTPNTHTTRTYTGIYTYILICRFINAFPLLHSFWCAHHSWVYYTSQWFLWLSTCFIKNILCSDFLLLPFLSSKVNT